MFRLTKLISLVILIMMPATASYADEVLWGTSTATGTATGFVGGVSNWPSFSAIGGTGVSDTPYRAMIVDTNFMWTRFTGAGLDADGSMYGVTGISNPSCTYGSAGFAVNAFDDHPCASSLAGNSFDINVNSGALPTSIGLDHNDPDLKYLCRDSNTLEHEVGTDFDVPISVNETNAYPVVMRDDSEGKYRIILGNTSGMDCVDPSVNSNMNVNLELMYSPTTADDLQLFMADKVHIDQYASRLLSQTILDFSWEDINPEMLGVVNLIPNGSFEDTCTGTGALGTPFVRSGAATLVSRTQPVAGSAFHGPILGLGCEWSVASWVVPDTLTTPTITASPGEFYVGSTFFSTNGINSADRSSSIRIRDNAGNNISNVKFWIAGPTAGTIAEDADIIDGSGTVTAGEYSPPERACYGGCFIKFAFQVESGDTGFDIQIARSQNIKMYFDELWVRKKMCVYWECLKRMIGF